MEQPPVSRVSSACWITGSPAARRGQQRLAHDASPRIGLPSSRNRDGARVAQGGVIRERFAHAAARRRADGKDAHRRACAPAPASSA